MKKILLYPALLAVAAIIAAPAMASTALYSNGPINGTINAWNTCCGIFTVSDSFTLTAAATVSGFSAGFWVGPGDSPVSTSWDISLGLPSSLGGTIVASGSGSYSNVVFCLACGFGFFDIYTSTFSGMSVPLAASTTYYLELFNGATAFSSNLFWDENDGPSTAYQNGGLLPGSESFTIYGGTSTPEPSSLLLLGSGVLGLVGVVRRKLSV